MVGLRPAARATIKATSRKKKSIHKRVVPLNARQRIQTLLRGARRQDICLLPCEKRKPGRLDSCNYSLPLQQPSLGRGICVVCSSRRFRNRPDDDDIVVLFWTISLSLSLSLSSTHTEMIFESRRLRRRRWSTKQLLKKSFVLREEKRNDVVLLLSQESPTMMMMNTDDDDDEYRR